MVVVSLVVVVITSLIARDGTVAGVEADLLRWVNGWPDWLEGPMWMIQQAGLLFAPLFVGAAVALAGRRWTLIVPFALVLPLKLLVEKAVVKSLIERERPYVSLGDDVIVRGDAFAGLSFPSGHTTTAFATAVLVVGLIPRRWLPVPLGWAAAVAIARMYMGEHNLYDVVCGAALGTLFGTVLWWSVLADPRISGPG